MEKILGKLEAIKQNPSKEAIPNKALCLAFCHLEEAQDTYRPTSYFEKL